MKYVKLNIDLAGMRVKTLSFFMNQNKKMNLS